MATMRTENRGAIALTATFGARQWDETHYQSAKRFFDLLLASMALIAALPLLLVAAVIIIMETRACPIYKQKRVGENGALFDIYKLRTMMPGTDHYSCRTDENDWRVTKFGNMLRSTKIDELPQLLNILRGEMSIVGPRPLSKAECDSIEHLGFTATYPGFLPLVKPGLIGLEQINRHRKLDYHERFALNYEYEKLQSLSLDFSILLRSLWVCRQVCFSVTVASLCEVLWMVAVGC